MADLARLYGPPPSGNCTQCGMWRQRLQRDHILPQWRGGGHEASNIQLLCANCHQDKTIDDLKDYKMSPEIRRRIGLTQRGRPGSRGFLDHKHTPESLAKMHTPEINARIGAAHRGRKRSPEAIEKQRRAMIGRKASAETRAKMSASGKARRARLKAEAAARLG